MKSMDKADTVLAKKEAWAQKRKDLEEQRRQWDKEKKWENSEAALTLSSGHSTSQEVSEAEEIQLRIKAYFICAAAEESSVNYCLLDWTRGHGPHWNIRQKNRTRDLRNWLEISVLTSSTLTSFGHPFWSSTIIMLPKRIGIHTSDNFAKKVCCPK